MRELDLLTRIYDRSRDLSGAFPQVLVGPGDDCAVIAAGESQLLLKVDQLIEGRHFVRGTPLDLIARKAVARAVSDVAAMAGTPTAALAAATLPRNFPQEPANQLFDAASRWARHLGCPLVGGDIASYQSAEAPVSLSITVVGTPHRARGPVLRSTAREGDAVYVTGAIGGSFDKATGGGRHLTFEPRLAEARWLADTLGPQLHAMMDISDGLGIDAGRLAAASNLAIELQATAIPVNGGNGSSADATLQALSAGEDYELLFTAPSSATLPAACLLTGTPITRIGTCLSDQGRPRAALHLADGTRADVSTRGWQHG